MLAKPLSQRRRLLRLLPRQTVGGIKINNVNKLRRSMRLFRPLKQIPRNNLPTIFHPQSSQILPQQFQRRPIRFEEGHKPRPPAQRFQPQTPRPRKAIINQRITQVWRENVEQRLLGAIRNRTSGLGVRRQQFSTSKFPRDDAHKDQCSIPKLDFATISPCKAKGWPSLGFLKGTIHWR